MTADAAANAADVPGDPDAADATGDHPSGPPPGADDRLAGELFRVGVVPGWVAVGLVALPFVLGVAGAVPRRIQYLPLVASAVVLGLPHGAVDHLVPWRMADVGPWRSVGAVVAVYAVLGGGFLAWWFLSPVTAAVAFVVLTWLHWGQGDVAILAAVTGGAYPRSRSHAATTLLVRGAMPMAVPLVAFPGEYRRVVANLVGLFGASVDPVAFAFAPGFREALALAVVALSAVTLARGAVVRTGGGSSGRTDGGGSLWADGVVSLRTDGGLAIRVDRGFRTDLVGTAVLWVFFLSVPPVLAVGLYFTTWHSLRHVARLVAVDGTAAAALRGGDRTGALARFARDAAPLTVASLVLLGGLYALVPRSPEGIAGGVALYLVGIAALTAGHVAVVTWMDHREGVWAG